MSPTGRSRPAAQQRVASASSEPGSESSPQGVPLAAFPQPALGRLPSPEEARLALRMAAFLTVLPVGMRLLSLPALLELLASSAGTCRATSSAESSAVVECHVKIVKVLFRINRWVFRTKCLRQSLVLFWSLRQAGIPVGIHFGVGRLDGSLEGHSWISLEGSPVAESEPPALRYREILGFPSTTTTPTPRRG